jgi:type VI secretion system protein ImpG
LLLNNTMAVALARSPTDSQPLVLDPACVGPVGFERDQGVFPYAARSFLGYRLLSEYFTFPEKFLFFDLQGLTEEVLAKVGTTDTLEVYFYLDRTTTDLEQNVTGEMFQLGCTPIVNLYQQRAEPIAVTQTQTEYRIVPDARRPFASEIYSVDRVAATSPDNKEVEYRPFYSFKHAAASREQQAFWCATRRVGQGGGTGDRGTEVYLSLVDLDFSPRLPAEWTLDVETTCLDRNRPRRLPAGEGQPHLRLSTGAPLERINCLTRPTATLRPALKRGALWQLISHLSLNHLSLSDYQEGADALREILKLYDFRDSAETRAMIDGIDSVRCRRVVGRAGSGPQGGFCRGMEVSVQLNEDRFTGSGVYLFASVLERFLGLYCSVNSFSKLVATTNRREGELRKWLPRSGETVLL